MEGIYEMPTLPSTKADTTYPGTINDGYETVDSKSPELVQNVYELPEPHSTKVDSKSPEPVQNVYELPEPHSTKEKLPTSTSKLIFLLLVIVIIVALIGLILAALAFTGMNKEIKEIKETNMRLQEEIDAIKTNVSAPWKACQSSPCENSGTCIDVNVDTFICICRDRYFGVTCSQSLQETNDLLEQKVTSLELTDVIIDQRVQNYNNGSNPDLEELNETVTTLVNIISEHSTNIEELNNGYEVLDDRVDDLEETDNGPMEACQSSPCENSATCIDVNVDVFICMCRDGYFGVTCGQSYADATFVVYLHDGRTGRGTVVFDREKINPGGHYNTTSGVYTVPYDGIYQFNVHLTAAGSLTTIRFLIYVDGRYAHVDAYYDGPYRYTTVILDLIQGQQVYLYSGTLFGATNYMRNYFSGSLLYVK